MSIRWKAHCGRAFLLVALLVAFLQLLSILRQRSVGDVQPQTPTKHPTILASTTKVNVAVYYETLCGDSRRFMTGQILETTQKVGHIMDLQLVPYGKAREHHAANGTWVFNCHFGPNECKGNLIQTCAINLYWKDHQQKVLNFISCMEKASVPHRAASSCAEEEGLEYEPIRQCKHSSQGNLWQHEMAFKTQELDPPLTFVPWITVNGVHDDNLHDDYLDNLTHLVCKAYAGEAPTACSP